MKTVICSCGHEIELQFGVNAESRATRPCLDCLNAQTVKKEATKKTITISYSEYKNGCYTAVKNSYNPRKKTIEVYKNNEGLTDGEDGFYYNGNFCG